MKRDHTNTPLVDAHLQSLLGLQEAETDPFFYTRLRAKMEKEKEREGWSLPLRPAWVIGGLVMLLAVNSVMMLKEFRQPHTKNAPASAIESFATTYNQTINTTY